VAPTPSPQKPLRDVDLIPLIANEPDQKRYGAHCQQDPRHDGDTARRNPIQIVILVPAQLIFAQAQKGMVVPDRAQIDTANLNIAYCRIVAPASGRVGLRQVDQGNYERANAFRSAPRWRTSDLCFVCPLSDT